MGLISKQYVHYQMLHFPQSKGQGIANNLYIIIFNSKFFSCQLFYVGHLNMDYKMKLGTRKP